DVFMSMLETAEIVAARYGISRESQDAFALLSQQRTAEAQAAGRFDEEIVPLATSKLCRDRDSGRTWEEEVTLERDECNRPQTTLEDLARLQPVFRDGQQVKTGNFITAGNASQLSDGASAALLMEARLAEQC